MKRLGAFIFSTILLIGVLGVLHVSKVYAQTSSQGSSVSNEQLIQHVGNGIFRETQLALANEKTAIISRKNTPQYQTELQTNSAEMAALVQARTTFESYLMSHEGLPAEQRYADALRVANMSLIQFQQGNQLLQQGTGKGFITKLIDQLGLEANKTDWIRAITTGQAISAESQQAANATKVAANPSNPTGNGVATANCSLTNLTACIDEGFAWLIKSTLLQFAGFLVWLTGNMLDFAVRISILNFSQWAPNTLYPIWMVIRQITSLFVVFAGLYLGFLYIIGREDTFGKYVGWLVIFALFVNFSYPFSRMLVDVSNIISLNIYSAALGPTILAGTSGDSAGSIIMTKLGLEGLVLSATSMKSGVVAGINTTAGALVALAFVLYAAYIFFMATAIMATRTAILVFLTVASPLLLVDSVVPKLGDAAVKMRKLFFEQLVVAPVFMIMLALTLKFMDVFRDAKALASADQSVKSLQAVGSDSISTFFGILMMLIMLHIMIKVTKSLAGEAGQMATNFMGKVGGFGLAAATMGTGVLARSTVGAAAMRARDSGWMDKLQGSRVGRGLYGLSNSLAQSTFDARNIGMVNKGMQKAGFTGGLGLTMQGGLSQGAEQRFAQKEQEMFKKAASIKDDAARSSYFRQSNSVFNTGLVKPVAPSITKAKIEESEKDIKDKRNAQLVAFAGADPEKRKSMLNQAAISRDTELQARLNATEQYLGVKNDINDPKTAQEKARLLKQMGISKEQAKSFLDKDPFKDIADAHEKLVKQMQEDLSKINRSTADGEKSYRELQAKIGQENASYRQTVDKIKQDTLTAFSGEMTLETEGQAMQRIANQAASAARKEIDTTEVDIAGFGGHSAQQPQAPTPAQPAPANFDMQTVSFGQRIRTRTPQPLAPQEENSVTA